MEPIQIRDSMLRGARYCASRPVHAMMQNELTWEALTIGSIGTPRYAGDDPNPRPVPEWGLAGSRRRHLVNEEHLIKNWHEPDVLYFTFGVDHMHFDVRTAMTVSTDDLWWIASPGDAIYLTDRLVHHCCGIRAVNREDEVIHFTDPFPDQFFLQPGMNEAGVRAQDLSITKAEFARVVYGIETRDTPDLLYLMLHARSRQHDAEFLFRAGMALLDDGRERFCHDAAALLCRALYVADTNGDSLLARTVASFCYLALTVAMYRRGVDTLYADVAAEKITNLRTRFGSLVLRQGLNADDLARAAYNAAQQQAFDAAAQLFDDALSREPRHQRASYYHGCVAFNTHDYAQAVDSLSIALQTNEIESRKHRLALEETDPRDRIGLQEARAEIERQTDLWRHEISTRARAFALSGQMVQAQNDVNALISHDDESVDAWKLAAAVHNALGDQTAAHNAFTKVLMHTSDPAERTALQAQIAQLQQGID